MVIHDKKTAWCLVTNWSQRQPFHILIADAALYAEGGEEGGDDAHDELEHGFEGFFVGVFHGTLIING